MIAWLIASQHQSYERSSRHSFETYTGTISPQPSSKLVEFRDLAECSQDFVGRGAHDQYQKALLSALLMPFRLHRMVMPFPAYMQAQVL